jgi:hypothetical protein
MAIQACWKSALATLLALWLVPASAATEVYVSRDENGNLIFSDRPSKNSEKHEVKELPTMPAMKVPEKESEPEPKKEPAFEYTSLAIVSPSEGTNIPRGMGGNISVNGVLSPGLQAGHSVVLLQGSTVVKRGRQTSFSLSNLSRGEYQFQLQVRDKNDEALISSQPVTVYVQRPTAN